MSENAIPGIDLQKALALPPLPGKPAPHQHRSGPTYTDGRREEPEGMEAAQGAE